MMRPLHRHLALSRLLSRRTTLRVPPVLAATESWPSQDLYQSRSLVSPSMPVLSSPFDQTNPSKAPTKRRRRKFVPRKAAVELTDRARDFFRRLLNHPPREEIIGIMLEYDQSKSGQPRMVFSFEFVTKDDITEDDEGVSLELVDGKPKPPAEAVEDGLPKLYVSHNAFLKVLGATVDVDPATVTPILYDREGNKMDPNA